MVTVRVPGDTRLGWVSRVHPDVGLGGERVEAS